MNYLLDTHIVLWWLTEPEKLAIKTQKIIKNKAENIFISSISFWEMAIKQSIGKLNLPTNILELLTSEGFVIMPVTAKECLAVADLPMLHSDPFDRLLIVQAKLNDLVIITRDEKMTLYPVVTLNA